MQLCKKPEKKSGLQRNVFNCTDGSVMHIANVTCAVCRGKQDVFPQGRRGQVLGLIFAGYVPLASQSPYPITVNFWPVIDPILVTFGQM